jgi:hypothetical protein
MATRSKRCEDDDRHCGGISENGNILQQYDDDEEKEDSSWPPPATRGGAAKGTVNTAKDSADSSTSVEDSAGKYHSSRRGRRGESLHCPILIRRYWLPRMPLIHPIVVKQHFDHPHQHLQQHLQQ